jgi:hypothetical protein
VFASFRRDGAGRPAATFYSRVTCEAASAVAGGDALAGWATCAPQEHVSQMSALSLPPSKSPQRWCSATKATRALSTSGMGRRGYHSPSFTR